MTGGATTIVRGLVASVSMFAAGSTLAAVVVDNAFSLRGDVWSGDRRSSDRSGVATASLWGRSRIDIRGDGDDGGGVDVGRIVASGWLRSQRPADAEPQGRLRELYWYTTVQMLDIRVGRQMVAWGRADGLNPTDNLSPRDFRLLAPSDGDLRHGNEAVRIGTAVPIGNVSVFWFPHAATHTIPLEAVTGVSYVVDKPRASQWAARWEFSGVGEHRRGFGGGAGIDGSVSYFDGLDPLPDLTWGGASATGVQVLLRNQRTRVLGADMSFARDGVVWRAEFAATRTASQGRSDFAHKKPQLWLVGGGEWTLGHDVTLGLQATLRHVDGFGDPDRRVDAGPKRTLAERQAATSGQSSRNQAGMLWRLAERLDHESLALEISGIALWSGSGGPPSGLVRAGADLALDDRWQVQLGGERYFGPRNTQLGQLRGNSIAYAQLRRGF